MTIIVPTEDENTLTGVVEMDIFARSRTNKSPLMGNQTEPPFVVKCIYHIVFLGSSSKAKPASSTGALVQYVRSYLKTGHAAWTLFVLQPTLTSLYPVEQDAGLLKVPVWNKEYDAFNALRDESIILWPVYPLRPLRPNSGEATISDNRHSGLLGQNGASM